MSVTSYEIRKAGNILFRFAEILESFGNDKAKSNCDMFFALEWASECHQIHSKIEEFYETGDIDDIINREKEQG